MGHHLHANRVEHAEPHFRAAFLLNLAFTLVEVAGGILTQSTAILADAIHDLGDSFSLAAAWGMERRSHRPGDRTYTFGYQRFSVLGGVISAAVLSAGAVLVLTRAIPRLFDPGTPHGPGMIWLAAAGIMVNGVAAWRMRRGRGINARLAAWHLLEDVMGWGAVLVGGVVISIWHTAWIDPLLSILITLFIMRRVVVELRRAMRVFLQAAPKDIDLGKLKESLLSLPQVAQVHHLHLWSLDGERHVLTAHLVLSQVLEPPALLELKHRARILISGFPVTHSTLEIEYPDETCRSEQELES